MSLKLFVDQETVLYTGMREGMRERVGHIQDVLREGLLRGEIPNSVAFLEEMKAVAALSTLEIVLKVLESLDEVNVADVYGLVNSYVARDQDVLKVELAQLAEGYTTPHREQPELNWLRFTGNLSIWVPFKAKFDAFMATRLKSTSGV